MNYLLYNPLSNDGKGGENLNKILKELQYQFPDIEDIDYTSIVYEDIAKNFQPDDNVILAGGDGTINFFANDYHAWPHPEVNFYLYPYGTGNDFVADILDKEGRKKLFPLNKYLAHLPKVKINDHVQYYINNVGYGLDGMVCEVADEQKAKGKKVNYKTIALSLLAGKYERRDAKITVDGVEKEFKEVWVAPAMNGRYYGGGMKAAPSQDRLSGKITLPIMFGQSRLHTIKAFGGIFDGSHIKHTEMIEIFTGKHIKVEFNTPCAIQVDGEVTLDVSSYEAWYDDDDIIPEYNRDEAEKKVQEEVKEETTEVSSEEEPLDEFDRYYR